MPHPAHPAHPVFSAQFADLARLTSSIDGLDDAFLKETSASAADAIVNFLCSTPVGKKALLLIAGKSGTGARNLAAAVTSVIATYRKEEGEKKSDLRVELLNAQCACYLSADILSIKNILESWNAPEHIKKTNESRNMLIASCTGPLVGHGVRGSFNWFDRALSITLMENDMRRPAVWEVRTMFMEREV